MARFSLAAKARAALSAWQFPGRGGRYGMWPSLLPSTNFDYAIAAGDPQQNTIVMATLQWIMRAFPEAPLRVMNSTEHGDAPVPNHGLMKLLRFPNPGYSGLLLWQATVISLNLAGNAYWVKLKDTYGLTRQLWYVPHFMLFPRWDDDGTQYITHYEYRVNNEIQRIPVDCVVHFRNGIDPNNTRMGLSPLAAALREIFTDNEAANYGATLLRNFGIPGLVISPSHIDGTIEDPDHVKRLFLQKFTGDKRGEPLVLDGGVKVDVLSFSPEAMNLRELRRVPEERISALLGVPAMVAGLGAGLDRSTFTNMTEARQMAYHSNIIPSYRLMADEIDRSLLMEFGDPDVQRTEFDVSKITVLQEDRNSLFQAYSTAFVSGVTKRAEAKLALGLPVDPKRDDVYSTDIKSQDLQAQAQMQIDARQQMQQQQQNSPASKD